MRQKMNTIKGFTFFKSYYESLKNVKEKDKKEIINAILEYVFDDKIPNFSGTKKVVWTLLEPNLNTSKKRSNPHSGAPHGNSNVSKEKQSKNKLRIKVLRFLQFLIVLIAIIKNVLKLKCKFVFKFV